MIKTQEDFLNNNFTTHFIAKVRKGCVRFYCERELETEHNWNILTPKLWPSALCLSRSTGLLNRRPRGSLCWMMAFFTASYQHLLWTPTHQGPNGRFGLMWLSLPHLVYNSTGCNSTGTGTQTGCRTQLSYIIVRRPLDLWNRMLNRHQAEITVMQFRDHSLPVHQSMSVPWEFFSSSHFISQFPPTAISSHNCH